MKKLHNKSLSRAVESGDTPLDISSLEQAFLFIKYTKMKIMHSISPTKNAMMHTLVVIAEDILEVTLDIVSI